jgi:hypothetical protein
VRWIAADVTRKNDPQHLKKFPLLEFTHPIEIKVQQGQIMLYLPSLWFHRVTQNRETLGYGPTERNQPSYQNDEGRVEGHGRYRIFLVIRWLKKSSCPSVMRKKQYP